MKAPLFSLEGREMLNTARPSLPTTLEAQFDEYTALLEQRGSHSRHTIRNYRVTYRLYVEAGYTEINDRNVEDFLEQRYDNPATSNKALAHLSSFVTWIRRMYPSPKYTVTTVGSFTLRAKKLSLKLPVVVDDQEATRFMDALERISITAHAHAVILRNTGLRFHEAFQLRRWHYWEPSPGVSCIKFTGKGRMERTVNLNAAAKKAFDIWVGLHTWPHENTIRNAYRKAEKEAGVRIKPHWFRHTVGTKLRANGNTYEAIADMLGNTVEVCRQRYSRMDYTHMKGMVDSL